MLSCIMIATALKTAPVLSDRAENLSLVLRLVWILHLQSHDATKQPASCTGPSCYAHSASQLWVRNIHHHIQTSRHRLTRCTTHFCGNLAIGEASTFKWTIHPNDVSCLKTYPNLIPYTGSLELVWVPFMVKGRWFLDAEKSVPSTEILHTLPLSPL